VVGTVAAVAIYVGGFDSTVVRNVGWDAEGYVVQIRAAAEGVLDLPATRPGVGVVGAFVAGTGLAPAGATPIVLSLVLVGILGLAAAILLHRLRPGPVWALGVAVLVVATWGGSARLASGYLANLLSLVVFTAGLALALGRAPWPAPAALFAGALFAHPSLLPAYAAIVLAWTVVDLVLDRGPAPMRRASIRAAAGLSVATAALAAVLAVLRVGPGELHDLTVVRQRFEERSAEILGWVDPALTLTMVVAGLLAMVLAPGRPRADAARVVAVWTTVAAGGLVALALVPSVPGHRTLLLGITAPILGALAITATAAMVIERSRGRPASLAIAATAAGTVAVFLALLMMRPFDERTGALTPPLGGAPGIVAAYLAAVRARGPVILVMDPPTTRALLAWKARQNSVRALAPDDVFLDVVTYIGDDRNVLVGEPTPRPGAPLYELVAADRWREVRAVLPREPIVLAARPWVDTDAWERLATSVPVVGTNVAVVRGRVPDGPVVRVLPARLPPVEAVVRIGLLLLVLAALGSGWSVALADGAVDAFGLAPAVGLAVVELAGLPVALAGADPGGSWGIGAVVLAAALGSWVAVRRRRASP
jgi:hypothetical protein